MAAALPSPKRTPPADPCCERRPRASNDCESFAVQGSSEQLESTGTKRLCGRFYRSSWHPGRTISACAVATDKRPESWQ